MTMKRICAACAAMILLVLTTTAVFAEMPGAEIGRGFLNAAESMMDGFMSGGEKRNAAGDTAAEMPETGSTLGDTNGDGVVESSDVTSPLMPEEGGMMDTSAGTESTRPAESGTRDTEDVTETAQSSSGAEEEGGMGLFGIILTVILIGAAAVLIVALLPKKKNG